MTSEDLPYPHHRNIITALKDVQLIITEGREKVGDDEESKGGKKGMVATQTEKKGGGWSPCYS